MSENERGDLRIEIERFGPGPETIDEVSQAALNHPSVREQLSGTRHRLLSVRLLTPPVKDKPDEPVPPDRYRATIYDYTNNRVVPATGSLDDVQGSLEVSEAGYQPLPTREEFDEAVEVLSPTICTRRTAMPAMSSVPFSDPSSGQGEGFNRRLVGWSIFGAALDRSRNAAASTWEISRGAGRRRRRCG